MEIKNNKRKTNSQYLEIHFCWLFGDSYKQNNSAEPIYTIEEEEERYFFFCYYTLKEDTDAKSIHEVLRNEEISSVRMKKDNDRIYQKRKG